MVLIYKSALLCIKKCGLRAKHVSDTLAVYTDFMTTAMTENYMIFGCLKKIIIRSTSTIRSTVVRTVSSTIAYVSLIHPNTILYLPFAVQTNICNNSSLYNFKYSRPDPLDEPLSRVESLKQVT